MNYNQFKNISCYEEFEIQSTLIGISKIDILRKIGHQINDYYFFASNDGIFNWYDLDGNHVEDPGVLKELKLEHIPPTIFECIIPDSVTSIDRGAFSYCKSLESITLPNNVTSISYGAFYSCELLKEITIPDSVTHIGDTTFSFCDSLEEVIFKGKTLDGIKQMKCYPFGIKDESIIKVSE